ncbi:MAG TPA: hypothetical protein PKN04_01770 [bacterium]|nr:hypothetical protein [bacterium]HNT64487.1 hypothetical protein [bacterium]HOX84667.1 hypothetical protein [bacterium]HPG45390.1 hypothetical protein [bacterium]HPM96834.1 hypothetical protein [bacterium]
MKIKNVLIMLLLISSGVVAQYSRREVETLRFDFDDERDPLMYRPTELIDIPTAFLLEGGEVTSILRFYEEGGLLGRMSVGVSSRIMFGVSFGGTRMLGADDIIWNEMPGVHFVYRIVKENLDFPEIVLGIDTQGYGKYWRLDDYRDPSFPDYIPEIDKTKQLLDRYSYKSRGFYAMASKGYESFRTVGLHIGASVSTETADSDKSPTLFGGLDLELTNDICALMEYDFAINDDKIKNTNNGRGYLNVGLRWVFSPNMAIEFDVKNLFSDNTGLPGITRILKFTYRGLITNED